MVGILKGDKPGPVIALRADMDALPIEEKNDLVFASKVKTNYNAKETSGITSEYHPKLKPLRNRVALVF